MQKILNILTLNNIDYKQHGNFGNAYYTINISNNCQIKLEYLWNAQKRKYLPAFTIEHISSNLELKKVNRIINLITSFL